MINEFYSIQNSLKSWGVNLEEKVWHPCLQTNAKGTGVLVTINSRGIKDVTNFPDFKQLRMYYKSNHALGITFKYDPQKKKVKGHLNCTVELADSLDCTIPQLKALGQLAADLRNIDVQKFTADLDEGLNKLGLDGVCYIALETANRLKFDNSVQHIECLEAIDKQLWARGVQTENSGSLDFFGNPDEGWEKKNFKCKSKYVMPIYSKNEDNECYTRYGMNGLESCRIGTQTRNQITKIVQAVLDVSKQNQWWFEWRSGKDSPYSFIVITSLSPNENLLSYDPFEDKDMSYELWNQRATKLVDSLRNQTVNPPSGTVTILKKPSNGPWNVSYFNNWSIERISESMEQWQLGMINGSTFVPGGKFLPPNIRSFASTLNGRWSLRGKEARLDEKPLINLGDAYNFLFNDPATIQRVTQIYAKNHVPMLLELTGGNIDKKPFRVNYLVPIGNLIIHKLGITKEHFMEHWAFCLGRLFREANNVHRAYFDSRGIDSPSLLIGHRFIRMAYDNPKRAYASFVSSYAVYDQWAEKQQRRQQKNKQESDERKTRFYSQRLTRELFDTLHKLTEGRLPQIMSEEDRALLCHGYQFIPQAKEKSDNGSVNVNQA